MNETVCAYLYRIIVAAAPLAIAYGVIERETAGLWIGLGGAVLSVGGNALAAAKTTPVRPAHSGPTGTDGPPKGA